MWKAKDLTGQRFGQLTVIGREKDHITSGGQHVTMWMCVCDCGEKRIAPAGKLQQGKITRCINCRTYPFDDLTGKQFNMLTVMSRAKNNGRHISWNCICECGNHVVVSGPNLKNGHIKSCGCIGSRMSIGSRSTTHGLSDSKLEYIWNTIKQRCNNPNSSNYANYGARGIKICDEWQNDFQAFYDWSMLHGYSEGLSIDRINNNGNYCPENCRWVSNEVQANNKRSNRIITFQGKTQTLAQWSRELNVKYYILHNRLRRGWSVERAFTEPIRRW